MFDAGDARVSFYSNETGHSYEVWCCARMTGEDCEEVSRLADSKAPRDAVCLVVSYFQELHSAFDYERDLTDTEKAGTMLDAFRRLRSAGISACVDGLSWG
jgi:hypothetical protein